MIANRPDQARSRRAARHGPLDIAFVLPALLVISLGLIIPAGYGFYLSLTDWTGLGPVGAPIGFANYTEQFSAQTLESMRVTAAFAIAAVPLSVLLGVILALAVYTRVWGWKLYKLVWFVPVILPGTVVGILWSSAILGPGTGLLDGIVRFFGGTPTPLGWLGDPQTVIPASVGVFLWASAGWPMLLLLAAMERIDPEIRNAALIDGAGPVRQIAYITLPLIRPVLAMVIVFQTISTLKVFDLIYVMTAGGPGSASRVWTILIYNVAFGEGRFGAASALAITFLCVIVLGSLAVRIVQGRLQRA